MNHSLLRLLSPLLFFRQLALVSCVNTNEISLPNGTVLSNKVAVQTRREFPSFSAMTPGKASFGAIGAIAMVSSGNSIIRENQVEDPANWISSELATAIQKKYGAKVLDTRQILDESAKAIAQACSGVDYALDLLTTNWSFLYFPVNWDTYRVI